MLFIHAITVFCVSQLPETKGTHMGGTHGALDDLALTEEHEVPEGDETRDSDHLIT